METEKTDKTEKIEKKPIRKSADKKSRRPIQQRERSEYDQKVIDLARTARVMAGGRRFSFRASIVIGNKKGEVGVGIGKAIDTAGAIGKALRDAKKNMIKIPLTKEGSIPHEVSVKQSSVHLLIKPVKVGKGLVAGSSVRTVLDLAGVRNANAKILSRSKNKLNNARAAVSALKKLQTLNNKSETNSNDKKV